MVGFSAGGHLTGLLGTTQRNKLFNTIGMILCYPVISFIKNAHKGSRDNFFGDKIKMIKKIKNYSALKIEVLQKHYQLLFGLLSLIKLFLMKIHYI